MRGCVAAPKVHPTRVWVPRLPAHVLSIECYRNLAGMGWGAARLFRIQNGLADLCAAANKPPHHRLSPPWPRTELAVPGLTRIDGSARIAMVGVWVMGAYVLQRVCAEYGAQVDAVLPSRPA